MLELEAEDVAEDVDAFLEFGLVDLVVLANGSGHGDRLVNLMTLPHASGCPSPFYLQVEVQNSLFEGQRLLRLILPHQGSS